MHKIIVTSDWHCGAATGLTNMGKDYGKNELIPYQDRREELWFHFTTRLLNYCVDADELWVVGDVINGPFRGEAKRDNLNNVIDQQCAMAVDIFDWICKHTHIGKFLIVEGTEWHVGDGSAERGIAARIGAQATKGKIIDRGGVLIDVKHGVGGSNRPHLHGNALLAEYEAAVSNANRHGTKIPDIIMRAHRHVFDKREGICIRNGQKTAWVGMILPSLQAWGSDYAKKVHASTYPDIGFAVIDVKGDRGFDISTYIFNMRSQLS